MMTQKRLQPLVPKLRFPEFQDTPPWTAKPLADLYGFKRTLPLSRKLLNFRPGDRLSNNALCEEGDIVPTGASEEMDDVGKAIELNSLDGEPIIAGTPTLLASRRESVPVPGFVGQLFQSVAVRTGIKREAQRSKVYGGFAKRIASVQVPIPSMVAEQQKIADCLGSLDDLIAAESHKRDALRHHKRALMQQLFPRPGESVPKLRFPEFRDDPDWEEVSLGRLLVRTSDFGINSAAGSCSERPPVYIRVTDIGDVGQFVPGPRVDCGATDARYREDGDIVPARIRGSVGTSYRVREEDGPLVYDAFLIRVTPNPERLLARFLSAYLLTASCRDWVRHPSVRHGQPGISTAEYTSIPLPMPPDIRKLAEQEKIADILGSLDDYIDASTHKIDILRQHKRGLVQQLFPNLEAKR